VLSGRLGRTISLRALRARAELGLIRLWVGQGGSELPSGLKGFHRHQDRIIAVLRSSRCSPHPADHGVETEHLNRTVAEMSLRGPLADLPFVGTPHRSAEPPDIEPHLNLVWSDPDAMQNRDEKSVTHYPGWGIEALRILVEDRGITATGHEQIVKVRRVGNSNAVSLPRELEASGYVPGTSVLVEELADGELRILPAEMLRKRVCDIADPTVVIDLRR
jgi:antitoxin component of MazEF toxin-antitoxin module